MQLDFRLRRVLIGQPIARQFLRPIVTVTLMASKVSWATESLLDTGSDHSAFSEDLAVRLGVDTSRAPRGKIKTATGAIADAAFITLQLRLTDDTENCVGWKSQVAFVRTQRRIAIFGYVAGREYFDLAVSESNELLTLTTNFRFPGVVLSSRS